MTDYRSLMAAALLQAASPFVPDADGGRGVAGVMDRRQSQRRTEDALVHYTREAVVATAEAWAEDPLANWDRLVSAVQIHQRAKATADRAVADREANPWPHGGTPDLRTVADG